MSATTFCDSTDSQAQPLVSPGDDTPSGERIDIRRGRGYRNVSVPADWAQDGRISFAAIGFLVRLTDLLECQSEPVLLKQLATDAPGSMDEVRALVEELKRAGYMTAENVLIDPFEDARRRQWAENGWLTRASQPIPNTKEERAIQRGSVVYYLRRGDGDVKIGYAAKLKDRVRMLTNEHGPVDLLATEPGAREAEDARHEQFRDLRIRPDREWFRPGPALLQHIAELAEVTA